MSKATIELRNQNGPLGGALGSPERLRLVGSHSIHGDADPAYLDCSRVRRDMQALIHAIAFLQRRMHPTQSPQIDLDWRPRADHVIAFRVFSGPARNAPDHEASGSPARTLSSRAGIHRDGCREFGSSILNGSAALDELKRRAARAGLPSKKSELLRAGLMALAAMADAPFRAAMEGVPRLKTGRPTKG